MQQQDESFIKNKKQSKAKACWRCSESNSANEENGKPIQVKRNETDNVVSFRSSIWTRLQLQPYQQRFSTKDERWFDWVSCNLLCKSDESIPTIFDILNDINRFYGQVK